MTFLFSKESICRKWSSCWLHILANGPGRIGQKPWLGSLLVLLRIYIALAQQSKWYALGLLGKMACVYIGFWSCFCRSVFSVEPVAERYLGYAATNTNLGTSRHATEKTDRVAMGSAVVFGVFGWSLPPASAKVRWHPATPGGESHSAFRRACHAEAPTGRLVRVSAILRPLVHPSLPSSWLFIERYILRLST